MRRTLIYRGALRLAATAALCVGLAGCRHRVRPVLPAAAAQTPVPLEAPPEPKSPALVPSVPEQPAPTASVAPPPPPAKRKKKAATPAPPPPAQVAAAAPQPSPAELLGSLTTGGDDAGAARRRAQDLLATNERRMAALPAALAETNRDQITRARNFDRQAREALNAGDAEGANTLATKAKLLIDDMLK